VKTPEGRTISYHQHKILHVFQTTNNILQQYMRILQNNGNNPDDSDLSCFLYLWIKER